MFSFFKKKNQKNLPPITTDVHSHLIPGVDDGVQSFEEAIVILKRFEIAGYRKVITTPHIMSDFYDNKESYLRNVYQDLLKKMETAGLNIQLELAAEYYLDEKLNERISDKNEEFLTFGKNNYLLFETSFMNEPYNMFEFIFKAQSRGIHPVLAHPERYIYLYNNERLLEDLINRNVVLQLNINSLSGYYSKEVRKFAERLINNKLITLVGSDCHNIKHFDTFLKSRNSKYFRKLQDLRLINNSL